MRRNQRQARDRVAQALDRVDPGRVRGGYAVGLRDGALIALLAGGLSSAELARLSCRSIEIEPGSGRIVVCVERGGWTCRRALEPALSSRVIAWLVERRGYGEDLRLFVDAYDRPLSRVGISAIVSRYVRRPRGRAAA